MERKKKKLILTYTANNYICTLCWDPQHYLIFILPTTFKEFTCHLGNTLYSWEREHHYSGVTQLIKWQTLSVILYSQKISTSFTIIASWSFFNGRSTFQQLYTNLFSLFSLPEWIQDHLFPVTIYIFIHLKPENPSSTCISQSLSCSELSFHWWSSHSMLVPSYIMEKGRRRGRWQVHCHWALESSRSFVKWVS